MNPKESESKQTNFEEDPLFFIRGAGIASILGYLRDKGFVPEDFRNKRIIELGCGSGSGLLVFHLLGADVAGVDLQKYRLGSVKRSSLIGEIPYYEGTSLDYLRSLDDSSIDAIFAFNVESDVWTDEVAEEADRVLKTSGLAVVTWQDVNLSLPWGNWPEGWPAWPYSKEILKIYDPVIGPEGGHVVTEIIDPRSLAAGRLEVGLNVSPHEVAMPDVFVMIGRKS